MVILSLEEALSKIAEIVNSCLGPLGSDGFTWDSIRDVLIQLGATLILFLVVKFFLWNRVTEFIDKRQEALNKTLVEAEEAKNRSLSLEDKLKRKYDDAKTEIKKLIDAAVLEGNVRKEQIINEATLEAKRRLEVQKEEINKELSQIRTQIKNEIVDVAFKAASKIVAREINPDEYLDVVDQILKEAL